MDGPVIDTAAFYGGATLAHVRAARRAAAEGNDEEARKLATQVIDAWVVADAEVPSVDEMRELRRSLSE